MDNIDKLKEDYIRRRFFEEDSECIEDLTLGYGCVFFSLIFFVGLLVLLLIYKFTE